EEGGLPKAAFFDPTRLSEHKGYIFGDMTESYVSFLSLRVPVLTCVGLIGVQEVNRPEFRILAGSDVIERDNRLYFHRVVDINIWRETLCEPSAKNVGVVVNRADVREGKDIGRPN